MASRHGDTGSPPEKYEDRAHGEESVGSDYTSDSQQSANHPANGYDKETTDGAERGGVGAPPQPVGFWDKSLRKTRLQMYIGWARMTLILSTFILLVLSFFWGVLYRVEENLPNLIVYVVDFDGQVPPYTDTTPLVGPLITQMTEQIVATNSMPHLGYITMNATDYNKDPVSVRNAVYDEHAWGAIVINPNATALLQAAVETGNVSYDPLGACQVIWLEARDQDTVYDYLLPQLTSLQTEILSKFGEMWAGQVLANNSIPRTTLQRVPQAINPAIGFSMFSLRPFDPPVVTPAVSIGLIYLIILAFFSVPFYLPNHMKLMVPKEHPPVKFWHTIVWRWFSPVSAYFFMSLAYSFVSLAFQIPFHNTPAPSDTVSNNPDAYHNGTFAIYWMINFVGMTALGLACENMAMIVGQPWTAMWLIFWVISNVATSFYSLDLAPHFYYWGYAWPLHNIVEASRSTLFDLHSRIGLDFGILFVWVAVSTALFPFACYFQRWKTQREKRKEAGQ